MPLLVDEHRNRWRESDDSISPFAMSLPPELLIGILAGQPPATLSALAAVNSEWNGLCQALLYRSISVGSSSAAVCLGTALRTVDASRLTQIQLGSTSGEAVEAKSWRIGPLLKLCPALHELRLSALRSVDLSDLRKGKGTSTVPDLATGSAHHGTAIRTLHLHACTLLSRTHTLSLPNLHSLSLRHCNVPTAVAVLLLRPSTLPMLRHLAIRGRSPRSLVEGFRTIASQLRSLSIDLDCDDPVNDAFGSLCTNLRLLDCQMDTLLSLSGAAVRPHHLRLRPDPTSRAVQAASLSLLLLQSTLLDNLEAIYLPAGWTDFEPETEEFKLDCARQRVSLESGGTLVNEEGVDARKMYDLDFWDVLARSKQGDVELEKTN